MRVDKRQDKRKGRRFLILKHALNQKSGISIAANLRIQCNMFFSVGNDPAIIKVISGKFNFANDDLLFGDGLHFMGGNNFIFI